MTGNELANYHAYALTRPKITKENSPSIADWISGKAEADAKQREKIMNSERHYMDSFHSQTMNDRPQMTRNNSGVTANTTLGPTQAHQVGPHTNNSRRMAQNQQYLNQPNARGTFQGQNHNAQGESRSQLNAMRQRER